MADDVDPTKKKIAALLRMQGSSSYNERRIAYAALERFFLSDGVGWSDVGNWVERKDGEFTEAEMLEYGQAMRAEGIEVGKKIALAHAGNGFFGKGLSLPEPAEMAVFCRDRQAQLKDDNQRAFVGDMYVITQRGRTLSPGRLGYLASIYIQLGGRT